MQITKIETLEQYNKFKDEFNELKNDKRIQDYQICFVAKSHKEEVVIDSYTLLKEWEKNGRCFKFEKTLYKLEKKADKVNDFFYEYKKLFGFNNRVEIKIFMNFIFSSNKDSFDELCDRIGVRYSDIEKTELSKTTTTTIPIKITKSKSL